jgi:hypothetical protein
MKLFIDANLPYKLALCSGQGFSFVHADCPIKNVRLIIRQGRLHGERYTRLLTHYNIIYRRGSLI